MSSFNVLESQLNFIGGLKDGMGGSRDDEWHELCWSGWSHLTSMATGVEVTSVAEVLTGCAVSMAPHGRVGGLAVHTNTSGHGSVNE